MTTSVHAVVGPSWEDLDGQQQEDYAWHLRAILGFGDRFLLQPDESAAFNKATHEQHAEAMCRTLTANDKAQLRSEAE